MNGTGERHVKGNKPDTKARKIVVVRFLSCMEDRSKRQTYTQIQV
jgi:hypothetical protein